MRHFYWYRSLLWYAAKHFRPAAFRAVALAVVTGSFLRIAAGLATERNTGPIAAFSKVVRLAGRCTLFGRVD